MSNTIRVVPGPKCEPGRVALWEKDNPEPGQEVFIAAPHAGEPAAAPVEVAETPWVNDRLQMGILARVSDSPDADAPVRRGPGRPPAPTPAADDADKE